jgi:hypothetical protein
MTPRRITILDDTLVMPVAASIDPDARYHMTIGGKRLNLSADEALRTAAFLISTGTNPWPLFSRTQEDDNA